jgi:hypothetical protein
LRIGSLSLVLAMTLAATGCGLDGLGEPHPIDRFDYPLEVTADPSGKTLWVTSGNFDLAYGGGAVMGVDITTHAFIPGASAEIGSYPGAFHLLQRDGEPTHGYILSRETKQLYHLSIGDAAGTPTLGCDGGVDDPSGLVRCNEQGVSEATLTDLEDSLTLGADPFGAVIRKARSEGQKDLLISGAMGEGLLATFELQDDGTPSLVGNMSLSSPVFALAEHPTTGQLYTTSKNVNVINVLGIRSNDSDQEVEVGNPWIELVDTIVLPTYTLAAMDHARDLAFTSDGARLLALHRSPSTVYLVDVRSKAEGTSDTVLTKVSVCSQPGRIQMVGPSDDDSVGELAYISCYANNGVDVVDPASGQLVAHIRTGRGPFGMAFIDNKELGIRRLYVANFLSQSVGVIELDPTSPYFHTQIAEIR